MFKSHKTFPMPLAALLRQGMPSNLLLFGFLSLLLACSLSASILVSVEDVDIENPFLLLNSDGTDNNSATNFHGFVTDFEVLAEDNGNNLFSLALKHRVRYQLLRDNNGTLTPVLLSNGLTEGYTADIVATAPFGSTQIYTLDALIIPGITLSSKDNYVIRGYLQSSFSSSGGLPLSWSDVSSPNNTVDSNQLRVTHFTNTTSGDAAYNVRTALGQAAFETNFALSSSPDQKAFEASVGFFAFRYDEFNAPPSNTPITFHLDFDLIEAGTGNSIPLLNDGITQEVVQSTSYDASGSRPQPAIFGDDLFFSTPFIVVEHGLEPLVQLDSVNESYFLRCTISHEEDANGTIQAGATCDGAPEQLLHFNGDLAFGSFEAGVTAFSNEPTAGISGPNHVQTTVQIPANGGSIPTASGVTFGNGSSLNVNLLDTGEMVLNAGSEVAYLDDGSGGNIPSSSTPEISFGTVNLDTNGATGIGFTYSFSQGVSFLSDVTNNRFLGAESLSGGGSYPLDDFLNHTTTITLPVGANAEVADESHPLRFKVSSATVFPSGELGFKALVAEYVHLDKYRFLEVQEVQGALQDPSMADRCSNDRYFLRTSAASNELVFSTASDGTARLSMALDIAGAEFSSHFPKKVALVAPDNSSIKYIAGTLAKSGTLNGISAVSLDYHQTCPSDTCTSGLLPEGITMSTPSGQLDLTPGGGLHVPGNNVNAGSGAALEWGKRSATQYAHRTAAFHEGSFYMPGYQLYAEDNTLFDSAIFASAAADQSPAALLLSGYNEDNDDSQLFFSPDRGYLKGTGDLAGFNFEVATTGFAGASRLGGATSDYGYTLLQDQSKYYVRESGVAGRHAAVDGTFQSSLVLKGFDCELTSFQLTFLENTNDADGCWSLVNGGLKVAGYSNWEQDFTGLRFDCFGEPGQMRPDLSNANDKELTYWDSKFDLKTLAFITYENPAGVCPKQFSAKIAVGAKARASHIDSDLYGTLAFSTDGNLSTQADAFTNPEAFNGINSQLSLPSVVALDAKNAPYNLIPCGKLRFNNPTSPGAPPSGQGFVNFAATIDVPYFRDLRVQAITSASGDPDELFALTPGWTLSGETFFNQQYFDPSHQGFPPQSSVTPTYSDYRDPANASDEVSETFLITAEQNLFGLVPISYPLFWDLDKRKFASNKPLKRDILVAEMEHQLKSMDAKFAHVTFGASFEGIPQLSIASWLDGELSKASEAIVKEIGVAAKKGIDEGLAGLDSLVDDSLCSLSEQLIADAAGTELDPGVLRLLYRKVETIGTDQITAGGSYQDFRDQVEAVLTAPNVSTQATLQDYRDHLCTFSDAIGSTSSAITEIQSTLEDIIYALDLFTNGVDESQDYSSSISPPENADITRIGVLFQGCLDTNGDVEVDDDGDFVCDDSTEWQVLHGFIEQLLAELTEPNVAAVIQAQLNDELSDLNASINNHLGEETQIFEDMKGIILSIRVTLVNLHTQLEQGGEIATEMQSIVADAKALGVVDDIVLRTTAAAWNLFLEIEAAAGITAQANANMPLDEVLELFFSNFTEEAFVQLMEDQLKDAFQSSIIIQQVQNLLRQYLYDVATLFTKTLQTVFAELTDIIIETLKPYFEKIEDKINPALGDLGKFFGTGDLKGEAEFNGDSLRKLRLDGKLQLKVPKAMEYKGFLEVLAYTSEDNFVESGCIQPGEKLVEVTIGAIDVPVSWNLKSQEEYDAHDEEQEGDTSSLKLTVTAKVSLETSNGVQPIGIGGSVEMTSGQLEFQTFVIDEFSAALAVGSDDCYLAAKARASFSNYTVAAGIFFGRTCTLEPLLIVDPDIGDVVDAGGTFTGAYVYGEVWLPISQIVLGAPPSCLFRVDAGVGAGAFAFEEGPTVGGKIFLGVSGEALCAVTFNGDVRITLAKQAGNLRGSGTGQFSAKVGKCPICVKFNRSVKFIYDNGSWSLD